MSKREPITAELRELMGGVEPRVDEDGVVTAKYVTPEAWAEFARRCDAIDAVHAQLEHDYKVACEVNECQDEQYADMVHKLDRAYEKNRNQRKQLTEVQEALHRRNEGELKRRWMREKQDLELQIAKMRIESVELPKDADGEYIHVGDVMESKDGGPLFGEGSFEVRAMRCDECGWEVYDRLGDRYAPSLLRHHHAPTVEDVLTEFGIDWEYEDNCEDRAALLAEYASKLRLAEGEDA